MYRRLPRKIAVAGNVARAFGRDRRGNVLLIGAASLIPLFGLLGGALDLTRMYMVRTRLQQACDASVMSGRAAMGNRTWDNSSKAVADRYFTANFDPGRYGTSGSKIDYEVGSDLVVKGAASVSLPMAIMQMFGYGDKLITATCDAKLELPNSDVMFVLDTTLSMSETNAGDSVSRIQALRNSVVGFHAILENARGPQTRVRYGFVPYASTVNVGTLLRPDWIADRWTYQSREYDRTEQVESKAADYNTSWSSWRQVSGSKSSRTYTIPPENCVAPQGTSSSKTEKGPVTTDADGKRVWTETRTTKGVSYSASLSNSVCTVTETTYNDYVDEQTVTQTPNKNAGSVSYSNRTWWKYKPVEYGLVALKATGSDGAVVGGTFNAMVANDNKVREIKWDKSNACIEERQTSGGNTPAAATAESDLDVDALPRAGNPATQWRPALPGLVYARKQTSLTTMPDSSWGSPTVVVNTSSNYATPNDSLGLRGACPTYARKLQSIDAGTLQTYMNALKPAGLTYHDIGFLWGLRLLSAQGIFANENQAPSTGKVARHLIFMTDGQTETNIGDYDAYGLSALDRRRTPANRLPTAVEQNAIVEQRLSGLCSIAKAKGVTVWVIAFGTSLTPLLSDCANSGHAFEAKNAAQLQDAFSNIAARISQLRLIK
ncbi:pilus assembly protein [Sphingomonas sp. HHU CXW]|uniref:Pilus assembly protein n=1 Tax=Sphingomonas hominis TaxID=2741495 RepID=A0ABX2JMH0_9SPHN|nr:pilus assembly protein [Sphingomonas hominis]